MRSVPKKKNCLQMLTEGGDKSEGPVHHRGIPDE
jgi:hypothetical protein